jgi:hypothetical protein
MSSSHYLEKKKQGEQSERKVLKLLAVLTAVALLATTSDGIVLADHYGRPLAPVVSPVGLYPDETPSQIGLLIICLRRTIISMDIILTTFCSSMISNGWGVGK